MCVPSMQSVVPSNHADCRTSCGQCSSFDRIFCNRHSTRLLPTCSATERVAFPFFYVVFPHQISLAVGARQCRRSVSAQFFESLPSPNIVSAARLQWPLFTGQAVTVLTSVKCAGRSAARYVASCPAGQKNPETAQQSDVHNFLAWLDPVDDRDLAACCTTASFSFFVTLRDVRSSQ